ncbi:MAG: hypothetical protein OZX49_02285 [Immundisolibacter sp.]|nr:hypothetical protein [Immundisolibacter sp.]
MGIDVDPATGAGVLAPEHGRSVADVDVSDHPQGDLAAGRGDEGQFAQALHGAPPGARVAQVDRVARAAVDDLADGLAADQAGHHRLHVGDVQTVAGSGGTVDVDVHIAPAGEALGQRGAHARHRLGDALDLLRNTVDGGQVIAGDLDPDRALDAGGQHVQTVADGRDPDIGQARHPHHAVQLGLQCFRRHAGPPLAARLELHGGLEHLQRRRVGGGIGAAGLAENARHLRHGFDQAVGLLQKLTRLLRRQPRQGAWHVQQVALVQRRQELAAQARQRPQRGQEHQPRHRQGEFWPGQDRFEQRPIEPDQHAVQGIAGLVRQPAANPVAHQHRHQRHRQSGRGRHGERFSEGQRPEQPALLRLQQEHRQEGHGDDQQREKQRRTDLGGGLGHHLPTGLAGQRLSRMHVLPGLDLLVRVLDHHDGGIDHGTDGDGNAAQRHDVGAQALLAHDAKRDQHAQRQRHDGHAGRAQVPQEHRAHQRHDDELLDQLAREVVHRAVDQLAAVVGGDDLHPRRQAGAQFGDLCVHGAQRAAHILARAQDHHAADGLALAVEFRDTAAHFRAKLHLRHIAQGDRHAADQPQRNGAKVLQRLQVAAGAHHEFSLAQRQHGAAGLLVGALDGGAQRLVSDAQRRQLHRIGHDLVLPDHTAYARHLGHVGQGFELEAQKPVLQGAQLRQVVPATFVDQRVLVNPADAGGIRPQRRSGTRRQARLHLAQVLQHPRARPVKISAVLEQHVDVAVAKERETAHRLRPRHRQQGGGQRIGDLILHHPRRLAGIRGAHDDLHVGQVRQGVDGRAAQGPDAPGGDQQRRQQNQKAVGHGPADDAGDHGAAPAPSP